MPLVVSRIRANAEADGSHALELSDGSTALIPRGQVQYFAKVLQHSAALQAFAQSQRPDIPAESPLAPKEFHPEDARSATIGRETNPPAALANMAGQPCFARMRFSAT